MGAKTKIYLISGLGSDRRLFQKLKLPENFEMIHIEWIKPLEIESLEQYALRLAENIDTSAPYYIIGLSYGGMIATEIAKVYHPVQTIIISSVCTYKEIGWYYKLAGKLRMPEFLPKFLIKTANPLSYWAFGAKTKEEKALLKQVLGDLDNDFMTWALRSISNWKNTVRPTKLFHIHGTADKILPVMFTKPDLKINGGEHLMVFTMAEKISKIIAAKLCEKEANHGL